MPDDLDSDLKFTMFLATIDTARFSDYEWRLYKYFRVQNGTL